MGLIGLEATRMRINLPLDLPRFVLPTPGPFGWIEPPGAAVLRGAPAAEGGGIDAAGDDVVSSPAVPLLRLLGLRCARGKQTP
jgi:hypothetical protein